MNNLIYYVVFLISVLVASLSQIILKKSAMIEYPNRLREYLNPYVIIAYILFFGAAFLTTFSYREVPLTLGPVLQSTAYIYIGILSFLVLKEKMTKRKILGNFLIIVGILIYTFL